jgi:hypothetical protein
MRKEIGMNHLIFSAGVIGRKANQLALFRKRYLCFILWFYYVLVFVEQLTGDLNRA